MIVMRDAMDRLFEETLKPTRFGEAVAALPIDAYITDDAILIQANLPGLKPEEVGVTLEGDTLILRGEFKPTHDTPKALIRERYTGKFERTLSINTPIDHSRVTADFENGVLTLTLPKAEAAKPRQIEIKPRVSVNAN
jgi:HSP20 family protein